MWGAFLPGIASGSAQTSLGRLEELANFRPNILTLYASTKDSLSTSGISGVHGAQAVPLITLEPWRPAEGNVQREFTLSSIGSGQHDADLERWALQLAAWERPALLRFAQEMNGTWYPWSIGVGGNTPQQYRDAWSRMHAIIADKAPNVRFVWAPNTITEGTRDFVDCYPGDDVVDYLGLDGYNWGQSPGHQWQSVDKLFLKSLDVLGQVSTRRPILITEVGCADGATPDLKAKWITDFFDLIEDRANVAGFLWFQMDKERDWRFNSTPASTRSFRAGLARWMGGAQTG
ncbi:glycoside hydrolase family 26 protein [Gordonia namibiensis]|nr:glycosyl hydrolase [Gordonia namibiensis]